MTYWCSNGSTSITASMTLVNKHDFSHSAARSLLQNIWKQKLYFPGGGLFYWAMLVSNEWFMRCCCSYKWFGAWWNDTMNIFSCCFKWLIIIINGIVCNWFLIIFWIVSRLFSVMSASSACTSSVVVYDLVLVDDELSVI